MHGRGESILFAGRYGDGLAHFGEVFVANDEGEGIRFGGGVWGLLEKVRGHTMAKAALETAIWDAEAKQKNVPLWKLPGGVREEISCGVSIGVKETLEELVAAVKKELAAGYQRIKIKIKPGKDLLPVQRLRQEFPRIKLMVDANSAYRKTVPPPAAAAFTCRTEWLFARTYVPWQPAR